MKRGFTIIELLVVVSIVGLVSSVALANLTVARQNAVKASAQQFEASVRHAIGDRLAGSWNFNEGVGNTAYDDSGNNLNGTISNNASYITPGVDGTASAIYFPGSNSYVNGTGLPADPTIPTTVSAWVAPTTNSNNRAIFFTGNGACKSLGLSISNTQFAVSNNSVTAVIYPGGQEMSQQKTRENGFATVALAAEPTSGELAQAGETVPNNQWTSIVSTFNTDGTVTSYVNGKFAGTVSGIPATNCGNSTNWSIGAVSIGAGVSQPFIGRIDNVAVYQGSITAQGAAQLYAEGLKKLRLAEKI